MAKGSHYRVTRAGKDVFVGDEAGLLRAAEDGQIRENDLVFDPATDAWVFARSHEVLEGHDLQGLHAAHSLPPADGVDDGAERGWRRRRRRRAAIGGGLTLLTFGFLVWVALGDGDTRIMQFIEDRTPPPTVVKAPKGASEAIRPSMPKPEDLVFDPTHGGGDSVGNSGGHFIEPTESERRAYGNHAMKSARRIVDDPAAPVGDERLAQLLGAAARAEFAKVSMQQLSDKEGIAAASAVVEEIRTAFMATCRVDNSKRYCELKLKNPGWPDAVLRMVEVEKVVVGMSSDHVFAAWGRPTGLRRSSGVQTYCYGQFCGKSVRLVNRTVIGVDE